jgi:hypothetical protein
MVLLPMKTTVLMKKITLLPMRMKILPGLLSTILNL